MQDREDTQLGGSGLGGCAQTNAQQPVVPATASAGLPRSRGAWVWADSCCGAVFGRPGNGGTNYAHMGRGSQTLHP